MSKAKRVIVGMLVCVAVLTGAVYTTWSVQEYRDRPYLHDNLYLPSGRFVEEISLGYRNVVADFVWFSAVQYFGEYRQDKHGLNYFEGLINIVIQLDPQFRFAYIFGAVVMAQDLKALDRAVDLLRRGMAANPNAWEYPFEIGFLMFAGGQDFATAANYFSLASRLPGAPEKARRFAAYVYSKAGDPDASLAIWQQYKEYTDDPHLKELAERYIEKAKVERARRLQGSDG